MSSPNTNQTAIALACVMDAALSAIDPSGVSLRLACRHLNDGLRLAEQNGEANNAAAEIVRGLIATLDEMEPVHLQTRPPCFNAVSSSPSIRAQSIS